MKNPITFSFSLVSSLLKGKPIACVWEVTYRCNAKCRHCDYWRRSSSELTKEEIKLGLDLLRRKGVRIIHFTGGEPLLRDDLEDIISVASKMNFWISIVTNGSLLTQERIWKLKESGLDNLLISLDFVDERHDINRNIPNLHQKVIELLWILRRDFISGHRTGGISCVILTMNYREIAKLLRLVNQIGVYAVFQPYCDNKTGEDLLSQEMASSAIDSIFNSNESHRLVLSSKWNLKGIFRNLGNKVTPCNAGKRYFAINPIGDFSPCVDLEPIGNILNDDLSLLTGKESLKQVHNCSGCWYNFRRETDSLYHLSGFLEKCKICIEVLWRGRRKACAQLTRVDQ